MREVQRRHTILEVGLELVGNIEGRLAELKPPVTGQVTGNLVLISKTNDEIAVGQAISVTFAEPKIAVAIIAASSISPVAPSSCRAASAAGLAAPARPATARSLAPS